MNPLEAELARRGIAFTLTEDGRYEIAHEGGTLLLSPDNVLRDIARDGDPARIETFLDASLAVSAPLPPWSEARSGIRWSAEPAEGELGDTLHEPVSDTVIRVLVYAAEDEGRITWLTPRQLERWGIDLATLRAAADAGLDSLLRDISLNVESGNGRKLGMIPTHSALKASTIFAPSFKAFVSKELRWPVIAVIPCRDFVYVLREKDDAMLGAIGEVVQREFRTSGYPITTEVFRISDSGVEAIGRFPE